MAQSVKIVLTDDIDGGEATQTIQFGFEGKNYEIDLNDDNAEKLRDSLAPFVTAARKTGGSGRGRSSSAGARTGSDKDYLKKVREWAQQNGHNVNSRGRVATNVIEAYESAH